MNRIHLTSLDIEANRQGRMSEGQMQALRNQRRVWIAGTVGYCLVMVALTAVLLLQLFDPTLANQGILFILIPLALFWIWLLRRAPRRWLQANRDLRARQIAAVEGKPLLDVDMGVGLFRTLKYHIHVDGHDFKIPQSSYRQFAQGKVYRVFFAPECRFFLGALSLVQDNANAANKSEESLVEPLTVRESEILHLIAAGLLNREIADQLALSVNTVKMYASQVYQKLNVNRRTEAVARARELDLL